MSARTVAGVVSGAVALACLAGLGAWSARAVTPASDPPSPGSAAAFLPADGAASDITMSRGSGNQDGTVEQSVARSLQAATAAAPLVAELVLAADPELPRCSGPACPVTWWQESVLGFQWGGLGQRLHAVTPRGIELRWFSAFPGLAFGPGALVLPADPEPGATWQAAGIALQRDWNGGDPIPVPYRLAGSVSVDGRAQAKFGADCREIVLAVTLDPVESDGEVAYGPDERSTWCPGRGIVERNVPHASPGLGFTLQSGRSPARVGLHLTSLPTARGPRSLVAEPLRFRDDRGVVRAGVRSAGVPWSDGNDGVTFPSVDGRDLIGTASDAEPGTVAARWRSHPGGQPLTMTQVGSAVLVATTQRTLVAYTPTGPRGWTALLPDLAVAVPVSFGTDGVAVLSADGSVSAYGIADGLLRWRVRVAGARLLAGADGRLAAVDASGRTTLLDPRGAVVARGRGPAGPLGVLVVNGRPVVWGHSWVAGIAAGDAPGWRHDRAGVVEVVAVARDRSWNQADETADAQVLVRGADQIEALRTDTGAVNWTLPGAVRALAPLAGGFAVVRGTEVVLYDLAGTVNSTGSVAGVSAAEGDQVVIRTDPRNVWVFARTPAGLVRGARMGPA